MNIASQSQSQSLEDWNLIFIAIFLYRIDITT